MFKIHSNLFKTFQKLSKLLRKLYILTYFFTKNNRLSVQKIKERNRFTYSFTINCYKCFFFLFFFFTLIKLFSEFHRYYIYKKSHFRPYLHYL